MKFKFMRLVLSIWYIEDWM